ncbi:glycosyltransferase family 4 protein [Isoptericola sp. S6320L]|uniref:glycosyltransferase family 4 protein n=1 Tax=Isoptericola sp. S6320L TaxID=2926411 RepID=UPI001FF669B1|nr:glycosyltransferase family 4 protein [Isoptericola sp. S6320L]MCK0118406.1 glycosyltransferase family 4 protein [Isoptericola sp. S6320L]
MERRLIHVITPGDHYSPRTGSAVPTVVHGLSAHAPAGTEPTVLVARGTYPDRYTSADVVEYLPGTEPGRWDRRLDPLRGALGVRRASSRPWAAALHDQDEWPPSVVVLHNAPQAVPLVDTTRHAVVLYAHNELLRTYSPREAARTLGGVTAVVCVSDFLAERTRRRLPPALRDRVAVVRNGVDGTVFRPGRRDASAPLEVTFVGRTIAAKGPDVLLEAVALMDRDDVHVTIVGSSGFSATDPLTPYERRVRAAAEGLRDRVTIRPFLPREAVADQLATTDVVVVPSVWPEPFALTVLEGMAAGAAVVASRTGGIPEAVADGGTLVPPGDPRALADALQVLADSPDRLAAEQDRARRRAAERPWSVVSAELDALLAARLDGQVTA